MKEVKFYYVYIITNVMSNKQYVGSKMCYKNDPNDDGYWGSSKYLNEDYKIYGKENFTKDVLKCDYTNKNDMLNGESEYILKYDTLEPRGYNRYLPNTKLGFHTGGCKRSEKTIEKIRKTLTGVKHTEERRKHQSESHLGIKHSEERRKKDFGGPKYGINNPSFKLIDEEELLLIINLHVNKRLSPRKIRSFLNNKYSPQKILHILIINNVYKNTLSEYLKGKGHPSKFKNMYGKNSPVYQQIPEDDLTKIINLYEKGMRCREIAKIFNQKYSIYKIRRALKEDNVYIKRKNTPKRKIMAAK